MEVPLTFDPVWKEKEEKGGRGRERDSGEKSRGKSRGRRREMKERRQRRRGGEMFFFLSKVRDSVVENQRGVKTRGVQTRGSIPSVKGLVVGPTSDETVD